MSARVLHQRLVTPDEYLESELRSPIKHEYVGGSVHAMAGAKNLHNEIVMGALTSLAARLRGKKCKPYNSDTKVRIQLPSQLRFYYPDLQVVCEPNPPDDSFQDKPVVIIEVLSASTSRVDEGEKLDAYLSIPTLEVYLLVDSTHAGVVAYKRSEEGFKREVFNGLKATIPLPCLGIELPLSDIYERADFPDLEVVE